MAMITCPECGQSISDHADHCIHCGTKFTVCPECGRAFAGTAAVCPLCGAAIAGRQEERASSLSAELPPKDLFKEWKKGPAKEIARYKTLTGVSRFMQIAAMIFLLVGSYFVFLWKPSLEDLLVPERWNGIIGACKALLWLALVADVATIFINGIGLRRGIPYYDWLLHRYGDPTERVKSLLMQARTEDELDRFDDLTDELHLAADKKSRTLCAWAEFFAAGLVGVLQVAFMGIILNLSEPYITHRLMGLSYSFDWSSLIAPGIIAGVMLLGLIVCFARDNINKVLWFKQIAPEDFKRIYQTEK